MLKCKLFLCRKFFVVARLKEITDTIYELQSSRFSGSELTEPIQLKKKTLGCSNFIFKVKFSFNLNIKWILSKEHLYTKIYVI